MAWMGAAGGSAAGAGAGSGAAAGAGTAAGSAAGGTAAGGSAMGGMSSAAGGAARLAQPFDWKSLIMQNNEQPSVEGRNEKTRMMWEMLQTTMQNNKTPAPPRLDMSDLQRQMGWL